MAFLSGSCYPPTLEQKNLHARLTPGWSCLILEHNTQARQHGFRKELGLRDLVFSQILNIVGLYWVGVAAKLGPSHVGFWVLGILLFYLPSAAVVIHLNHVHTLEGGLYEWSPLGFNEFTGFLVGWNLWFNAVAILSYAGIQAATMLAYVLGPQASWIAESKWAMVASPWPYWKA